MEDWKQYVLSIIACALCSGVISSLLQNSGSKDLVRLICGSVLAVTVLRPLSGVDIGQLTDHVSFDFSAAQAFVQEGKKLAGEEQNRRIKESCEAYILDKAEKLGVEIDAEVDLDENRVPYFAEIRGKVAPDIQYRLEMVLESDLGITKEKQRWTGNLEENSS